MENNQGGGNKKIYIALIVLLLLINVVAFYLLYSENKAKNDLTAQKTDLQNDFKKLTDTLDAKKMELEQFRGKNAELDSIINDKQAKIEEQKKQISGLFARGKMSSAELDKAKAMIKDYEASIADLQKKVDDLTKANQQLSTENKQLNSDLTNEKQTTAQLSEQNKGLSKKVELGSLLQLRNLVIEGIEKKKNGKEVTEKKVKKVESLRITFETGDNKVLEPGKLTLYVRIINQKGETISIADEGSGTLKLAESGEAIQYTKQVDIDWAQTNKKVIVYWSSTIKAPGIYKVEVYQSGYVIGTGQVEFK